MSSVLPYSHPKRTVARLDLLNQSSMKGVFAACASVAFHVADESFLKTDGVESKVSDLLVKVATVLRVLTCLAGKARSFPDYESGKHSLSMSNVLRVSASDAEIDVVVRLALFVLRDPRLSIAHPFDRSALVDAVKGLLWLHALRSSLEHPLDEVTKCVLRNYCRSAGIEIPALEECEVLA